MELSLSGVWKDLSMESFLHQKPKENGSPIPYDIHCVWWVNFCPMEPQCCSLYNNLGGNGLEKISRASSSKEGRKESFSEKAVLRKILSKDTQPDLLGRRQSPLDSLHPRCHLERQLTHGISALWGLFFWSPLLPWQQGSLVYFHSDFKFNQPTLPAGSPISPSDLTANDLRLFMKILTFFACYWLVLWPSLGCSVWQVPLICVMQSEWTKWSLRSPPA